MSQPRVTVSHDSIELTTYSNDVPDPNPRYYEGYGHQGVQRHAYPYPMDDNLRDTPEQRHHRVIFVENAFVRVAVMPQFGGRILYAEDKTNGYEYIYKNIVIKPSLIGMAGSWISGGIGWGFPHHHGPLTMAPFEHKTVANSDGSATIWMGKTDVRHRMRMTLAITLRPDASYVEARVFLDNRTPFEHSMLYWANPSVKADPSYQVLFGPSVQYAAQHHKVEFVRWPIGDCFYSGADYAGVDVSYWKNVKRPSSFFAWNCTDDFVAGYSHQASAGTVHVGDHHILCGMKTWEHGDTSEGNIWRNMLTDNEDHYIELMVGAYSDNQPDYSWIQPHEVKHFTHYWYPIRDTKGLKYANIHGALNFQKEGDGLIVYLNTTRAHEGARIVMRIGNSEREQKGIRVSPDAPARVELPLHGQAEADVCSLKLLTADGSQLISWTAVPRRTEASPIRVSAPDVPSDVKTVEELYLKGRRLDQFYNPTVESDPYFEEALRRDPGNHDVNVWLGIRCCKALRWEVAERHFRTAIERVTFNQTRPRQCEAYYYLGLALEAQDRDDEAYDVLHRAAWSGTWHTAAYFEIARIDCRRGDYETGLEHAERASETNTMSGKVACLQSVLLRKSGRTVDARTKSQNVAARDPLDVFSRNELLILSELDNEKQKYLRDLEEIMQSDCESHLELAIEYEMCGCFEEALSILERMRSNDRDPVRDPILLYHLGYYQQVSGNETAAQESYAEASSLPTSSGFPWRAETARILRSLVNTRPEDPRPSYYLGTLLYPFQPEAAIASWERSLQLDDANAMTHRNAAWGYLWHEKNPSKAAATMEKAVSRDPDPRYFYELDLSYERARTSPVRRLAMLLNNRSTVEKRDDSAIRLVIVMVLNARYDEAIEILTSRHFHGWEGVFHLRSLYESTFQLRGITRLENGDPEGALSDFEQANKYPENLDVGRPLHNPRFAQTFYLIGLGNESSGRKNEATAYYLDAISENADDTEYLYYQGLAYKKLGRDKGAESAFTRLETLATKPQRKPAYRTFSAMFESDEDYSATQHFIRGLAYLGKGVRAEAMDAFKRGYGINPTNLWIDAFLRYRSLSPGTEG